MPSDLDRPHRTARSGPRPGASNGGVSTEAAQSTRQTTEGSSAESSSARGSTNGGVPAGLFGQLPLSASAKALAASAKALAAPAKALAAPAKALGDPLHLRLSAENRRLAVRLRGVEAELAALRWALERATSDALTDPLTGLANRRAFDDALRAAANRACEASPAQLLIADIDHFKALNDAHGHHFGDAVLCITGEVLKAAVRRDTVVARLGGDEFALLLPGPTADYPVEIGTAAIARRLCARIAQRPLTVRGHPERRERITLSIGLAGWRPGESPVDWYSRADAALYAAKRGGRNQVVMAAATAAASKYGRPATSPARHGREDP
jgi:diguanylate cyclase